MPRKRELLDQSVLEQGNAGPVLDKSSHTSGVGFGSCVASWNQKRLQIFLIDQFGYGIDESGELRKRGNAFGRA